MNVFTELTTKRLLIRQFNKDDEENFVAFMTDPLITNNLAFDDTVKTKDGALALLNQTINSYGSDQPLLAFAITDKVTNSFFGVCGTNFLKKEISEIFFALFPGYWGKGYATEVLSKLSDYLVQTYKVKEIHAFIAQQNLASIKVVEKTGFTNRGLVLKENFSDEVYEYVLTM